MMVSQVPPDRVEIDPGNQQNQDKKIHDFKDFRWIQLILFIALTIIILIVSFKLIFGGGELLAGIVSHIVDWHEQSTLNPQDTEGFTNFLRLVLTALIIGFILYCLNKF